MVIGPRAGGPGQMGRVPRRRTPNAYALDAATGEQMWTRNLEDHASANITGTPTLYRGPAVRPVASIEEGRG